MSSAEMGQEFPRHDFINRQGVYEKAPFGQVVTAMVTPFDTSGALSLDKAQELADYLAHNGSEGLVLAGTTGESPALTDIEEISLFRAVRDAVDIPILAGTGSDNQAEAVDLSRRVAQLGIADGLLVVTPPYVRPTQSGIKQYYRAIAEAAPELPLVMYDIPIRTGQGMSEETTVELAEIPNIVGLKDATGKLPRARSIMARTPDDFVLYSGDDKLNLEFATRGAVGAISVASHWAGKEIKAMFRALANNNYPRAQHINDALQASYKFESSDEARNPVPAKAMMRILDIDVGYCRPPMDLANALLDFRVEQLAEEIYTDLARLALWQ